MKACGRAEDSQTGTVEYGRSFEDLGLSTSRTRADGLSWVGGLVGQSWSFARLLEQKTSRPCRDNANVVFYVDVAWTELLSNGFEGSHFGLNCFITGLKTHRLD